MSKKEVLVKTGRISGEWRVSIYLPVDPHDGQRNRFRLKELMFEAERRLLESEMTPLKVARILLPLELLLDDPNFWQSQKESFALYLTPTSFERVPCPAAQAKGNEEFTDAVSLVSEFHLRTPQKIIAPK
jgi:hypothetical protein